MTSYERGEWVEATRAAEAAGIQPQVLASAYQDALQWVNELAPKIGPSDPHPGRAPAAP